MSAWIPSKPHIDLMVAEAVRRNVVPPGRPHDRERDDGLWADEIGQMLTDEVVASVSACYPNDVVAKGELPGPGGGAEVYYLKPYAFEDRGRELSDVELYKTVSCYRYQACEHADWEASEAAALCERLVDAVIVSAILPSDAHRRDVAVGADPTLARLRGSTEWNEAPWGWDESHFPGVTA